ncbi:hypothetical protein [Emticicia agri]|uniref:Uncharacterized protein n=1 Tax=Emticicia agri TaxID=2492393 RepID=A0A4Q5M417_9BACT|nr:hypothetical protein [Emticicia agri]RYU97071.1 hypothetical protein EWM59_03950 [Emticicia agri]
MIKLESIKNEILSIGDINSFCIKAQIEVYTREDGSGIRGQCFDSEGKKISSLNVSKLRLEFDRLVSEWNALTSSNDNKWNKAELSIYRNGNYEVTTWWDTEIFVRYRRLGFNLWFYTYELIMIKKDVVLSHY